MAIQNFISGGYYGKLGETVGQRWKNKRTIRKYVVPKKKKKKKQQANRSKFGSAVPWAHIGMTMNFKNAVWGSSGTIEWNQRMSVVLNRMKRGLQGMQLIPLAPENFVAPYFINQLTISSASTQEQWVLDVQGVLPTENRTLLLCVELWSETEMLKRDYFHGFFIAGDSPQLLIAKEAGWEFNQFTRVVCANIDFPEDIAKVFISSELTLLPAGVIRQPFNSEITSVTNTGNAIVFQFAEPFIAGTNLAKGVTTQAIVAGKLQDTALHSPTLINQNGFFALQMSYSALPGERIPAYTSGAWLSIAQISCLSTGLELYAENLTLYPQEESPAREYTTPPTVKVFSTDLQGLAFSFDSTAGAATSAGSDGTSLDLASGVMSVRDVSFYLDVEGLDLALYDDSELQPAYPPGSKITLQSQMYVTIGGVRYNLPQTIEGFTGAGRIQITEEPSGTTIQASDTQITITFPPNQSAIRAPVMQAALDTGLTQVFIQDPGGVSHEAKQLDTLSYSLNADGTATFTLTGIFNESAEGTPGTPESVYLLVDQNLELVYVTYMYVELDLGV